MCKAKVESEFIFCGFVEGLNGFEKWIFKWIRIWGNSPPSKPELLSSYTWGSIGSFAMMRESQDGLDCYGIKEKKIFQ